MKKIKAEDAKPGKFYIIDGKLFMCILSDHDGFDDYPKFSRVGDGFEMKVWDEKIKPVNVFMFSK